jgi:glutathione peroxidase
MAACPALLERNADTILDQPQSLCEYAGKVLLVVNTASQCGYTPQHEGLEALYRKYQEPGSNKEITAFCVNQYAIDFPMFSKTSMRGAAANPLFTDLAKATGTAPRWNFHKYLVDRSGTQVQSFDTRVEPDDAKLVAAIEGLLKAP